MPNVKASLINKPFSFAGLKKRYYICNVLTIMETVFSVSYQETESFQNFFPFEILPRNHKFINTVHSGIIQ